MMVNVLTRRQEIYGKLKRSVAESLLSQALNLLGHSSEKNYQRLAAVLHRAAHTEQQKLIADWVYSWVTEGPGAAFLTRVLRNTHPNTRKRFLSKTIINLFFRDPKAWARIREEHGLRPPSLILFSPTMRCNYNCVGCYAGSYTRNDDLPPEVFDRVLTEAEELSIRFFSIVGGEPFIYRPLFDIFRKHKDATFQIYTNGSLIDATLAGKLAELGNVAPQISIEGFEKETDSRRGKGAFGRAVRAMDNLREKGCLFGFSAAVSHDNLEVVSSEEFIDFMIEKGATYGWYFLYMPVGGDRDLDLMPTPEERNRLRIAVSRLRQSKPILIADFWGDSPLTGGCIAGGRIYLHINHKGDLEPCVFCHFTTPGANIKEKPLIEALKSPLLASWRRMQPFSYNTLRPCPIIDHPRFLRTLVRKCGAVPTHEGAETVITELAGGIDEYSDEMKDLYTPTWERDYPWGETWMRIMDFPGERVEQRKRGYLETRRKEREKASVPR